MAKIHELVQRKMIIQQDLLDLEEEIRDANVFGVMVGSLSGGPGGGDGPFRHLLTYYHHTTLYSEDRQTSKNGKTLHSYNIHIFMHLFQQGLPKSQKKNTQHYKRR